MGKDKANPGEDTAFMGDWVTSAGRVSVMPATAPRWATADIALATGLQAKATDHLKDAEEALRNALQIGPLHIPAMHSLGLVLRSRGQLEEAVSLLHAAAALAPDDWAMCNELGLTPEQRGHLYHAHHLYQRAIELPGAGPGPAINRANVLARLNRTEEAINAYRAVMARAPERSEVAANLATVLEKTGQLHAAAAVVRDGLAEDRRNPMLNLTAARLERRAKHHPKAMVRLRKILDEERAPSMEAAIRAELGYCHDALDETAEAMVAFTRANRLMRREARALIPDRNQVFTALKRCTAALETCQRQPATANGPLFVVGIPSAGCSDLAASLLGRTGAAILVDPGPWPTSMQRGPSTSPQVTNGCNSSSNATWHSPRSKAAFTIPLSSISAPPIYCGWMLS